MNSTTYVVRGSLRSGAARTSVSLKEIQSWHPAKITTGILSKVFSQAEQQTSVNDSNIMFAEGLKQKFKGLMLSSMGLGKVTPEHFDQIMAAPMLELEVESRLWRIRCAQIMLWLDEHASHEVTD